MSLLTALREFFVFAFEILPELCEGFKNTLTLLGLSLFIGFVGGVVVAVALVYGGRFAHMLATIYSDIIRGTPILVQIFIIYFCLPSIGIVFSSFVAGVLALGINSTAYQAEYFRGVLNSVGKDQEVAARSVGLSKWAGIKNIILPQALRLYIFPFSNEAIYLLKYTSLAYLIGFRELMMRAQGIASWTYRHFEVYLIIGMIYLLAGWIIAVVLNKLERKVRIPGLGAPIERPAI